jgi:hypothetical protein
MAMRLKYLPLLMVYFSYSFAAFSQIAEMFWIKDSLTLTSSEIISITIWANLPWSMKIIFGQFLDSVRIAGSQRKSYIFIAAFLIFIGSILILSVANNYELITSLASTYHLLILAGALANSGFVLQDLVADTLCYDVVDKVDSQNKPLLEEDIKEEIGKVQILVRIVDISAAIIAVTIGGIIATKYSYATISYFIPCLAFVGMSGSLIIKEEPKVTKEKVNLSILIGGATYLLLIALVALVNFQYSQEITFFIGLIILSVALYRVCVHLSAKRKREVFAMLLVIFAFRSAPTYGPGIEWWQIDVLGFTPDFFATLAQVSLILGFIGLWIFGKYIIKGNVGAVLLALSSIHLILQLPIIAMAFGFHEWTMEHFGFGAKTIALIDGTAEAPFLRLSFLLLCSIATYYAPKHNVATWFALVMSLMSIAYVSGGRILKRIISESYVIERGNYENVADQMIVTTAIGFLMPVIAILLFMNPFKKNKL